MELTQLLFASKIKFPHNIFWENAASETYSNHPCSQMFSETNNILGLSIINAEGSETIIDIIGSRKSGGQIHFSNFEFDSIHPAATSLQRD